MTGADDEQAPRTATRGRSPLLMLAAPLALVAVTQMPTEALASPLGTVPATLTAPGATTPEPLPLAMLVNAVAPSNKIDGLGVEELDDGTTVLRLVGSAKPTFNVYRLSDPDRLVVDLAGATRGDVVPHVPLDTWACGRVSVDAVSERDAQLVRFVVELKREVSYVVVPKKGELVVTITPRQVAPEAYFARKDASTRQQELQAKEKRVAKAERNAKALGVEAKLLNSQARKRAEAAKKVAKVAGSRAAAAREAETKALEAERRALEAEKTAGTSLKEAKGQRFKARRLLKQAQAEREAAEKARAEAQTERKNAELARANADADVTKAKSALEAERVRMVTARHKAERATQQALAAKGRAEVAEQEALTLRGAAEADHKQAKAAKTRAAAAERAAKAAQSAAESKLAQARAELSRAKAAAGRADADAKAKLAKAERAKASAETAAKSADRAAAKKLATASERADKELARATTKAQSAEREAKAKLAAAKTAEKQAKATLAAARAEAKVQAAALLADAASERKQAKADAQKLAVDARREAKAEAAKILADAGAQRDEATRLKHKAKAALTRAETAVGQAETERKAAADARSTANTELAAAKERAATASRGDRRRARRALASAQQAQKDAEARHKQTEGALAELRRDRDTLKSKLAEQKQLSESLHTTIQSRQSELARLERKVAEAKRAAAAKAKTTEPKLANAQQQLSRMKVTTTVLQTEVGRLRGQAEGAESRARAAEAKVARLKQSGAAKADVAKARANAKAAQTAANKAAASLAKRKEKLAAMERTLTTKRAAVARLETKSTELRTKNHKLTADNAIASRELAASEAELAQLRASLEAQRNELTAVTQEVVKARADLDGRIAAARPKPKVADKLGASRVKDVRFEHDTAEQRVVVAVDGPIKFEGSSLTPTIKMLSFDDAAIAKKLERSLDASSYAGVIKSVTSFAEGDATKVLVSTFAPSKARVEERPGELVWHFPAAKSAPRGPKTTDVVSMPGSKVAGYATGPGANSPLAAIPSSRVAAFAPPPSGSRTVGGQGNVQPASRRRTRWRGERIDIELQEAPIKDVLLLFSDIGHVNIIAGRGVEGAVTMKLNAVPWDQALDIILRSLALGSNREGNVIRVATVEDLEAERRQAIERANARVQLKPLETRLVPVSYATVDEMIPKVQSVLSPRGTVTPDQRTNTLIIMDVSDNIALAEQLISSLDTQTPQVLIEARIVEARTNFTRNLGIQWGFDFTASPGTGNPTGLLFPNSLGIGGGGTGQPADVRGLVLPGAAANPNYAVDLPAPVGTGQGGAVGFSFGSITGNLNTNLRISAAESTGEVRIISAPKVVTLDNNEAQIETGVQIPISQVSAQGVNTRFVNATLALRVTPQVTNEGAVLLDVQVQKNEADFINTGARGDPTILTNQARSRLLVNDADTAVIGGIYTRNKAVNFTKIPWLADIPIVGWFFKNKSEADTRSEILIFLTPKIVNRASSIGG